MLEFPDRHQIASPGFAMLSRTGLAHLMRPGSGGTTIVGICSRESIFASARDFAWRYIIIQNGSGGAHEPIVRRHRFG
jgi:hypothetical protein